MAERVGFIGLGIMGTPMSKRLIAAGYELVVYDVKPEALSPLLALGAVAVSSPSEVGRQCSKVITMLPNSTIVEQVVLGTSGLIEGFAPGSILIEMSSSSPSSTKRIAERLSARSVEMIDAPVSGAPFGAAEGSLAIMVGGKDGVFADCLPILQTLGKNVFLVGPNGAGHTMKALNNMLYAINMMGVCEALVLGVKAGLVPEKIVEVIGKGSGQSFALDTKAVRHILANNYEPGFTTNLLYKDLDTATGIGRELGVPLLAANLVQQVVAAARGSGMGHLDNSCILKLLESATGVKVILE